MKTVLKDLLYTRLNIQAFILIFLLFYMIENTSHDYFLFMEN